MTKAGTSTLGTAKRRPNLFLAESRLARAYGALEEIDPDLELSADEHESILAQYVDRGAAVGVRDEFVEFVTDVEGLIEAKRARAKELAAEATSLDARLERMRAGVAHMMVAQGQDELRGEASVIVLTRSRGAVEVLDQSQVPAEFWRVPESVGLTRVRGLVGTIKRLVLASHMREDGTIDLEAAGSDEDLLAADRVLEEAEAEVRTVDKKAIQDYWKEHGDTKHRAMTSEEEVAATLAQVPQTVVAVPTVPGTRKKVELGLKFK